MDLGDKNKKCKKKDFSRERGGVFVGKARYAERYGMGIKIDEPMGAELLFNSYK